MHNYSIIIPVHNEVNQVPSLLNSLKEISDKGNEIIIIDDGSNDGSTDILSRSKFISLIILDKNKGKGYAIRKGLEASTNNKIVIYDGDMELDPLEIDKLMILNKSQNINFKTNLIAFIVPSFLYNAPPHSNLLTPASPLLSYIA